MRHGKKFNHLGRKVGHRRALLKNLSAALIMHKRINTTLAKAKALRKHIEPIITKAVKGGQHNQRVAFSYLQNKEAIKELVNVVAPAVGDRPGGYTRVIRTGFRRSDGAEMAMIELVDFNDIYSNEKEEKKSSGRRRRRTRRGGSGSGNSNAAATTTEATADDVAEASTEADNNEEKDA